MPRGRPPKHHNKRTLKDKITSTKTETDDLSLRRSSRKRTASTYQEDDQQIKRRKEDGSLSEEIDTESEVDEAGEKKIDKHGNLQDERVFKVPTFTLPTREETVLMLAMDPAKIMGFRDSHIFFNKNPTLERVRLTEEEKDILVERNMVLSWFRHRDVAVVTARSVFKRFGAKIIKKGKRCRDDYFEAKAREQGYTGETTTVEKKSEVMALGHVDDAFGFDHMDDAFSHSRQSILNNSKVNHDATKYSTSAPLTHQTWLHHSALASRGFNAQLRHCRNRKSIFYDTHTNINQVPSATQPRKCQFIALANDTTPADIWNQTTIAFEDDNEDSFSHIGYLSFRQILDGPNQANGILKSLPSHIRPMVTAKLANTYNYLFNKDNNGDDDDNLEYPIAVYENQHQDAFPIHFTRFGMARPIIQGPTAVIGKTQSMIAQQHYLNQVYQHVNSTKNLPQQNQFNTQMPFVPQHIPPVLNGSTSSPKSQNMPSVMTNYQQKQPSPTKPMDEKTNDDKDLGSQTTVPLKPTNQCAECHQTKTPPKTGLSSHRDDESPICDSFTMVPCSKCQRRYHPSCANLTTPKQLASVESYPWSCPECKICCVCDSAGDETKLMICDGCDRGWHTDCCTPPVNEIPEGSWLCPFCAVCHSCDSINVVDTVDNADSDLLDAVAPPTETYNFPAYLATYCQPCSINFEEDRFCPVCLKSYADGDDVADDDKEMVACDSCDRWIHCRCDDTLTRERYQELCDDEGAKYSCPLCAERVRALDPKSSIAMMALQGLTRPSGYVIGTIAGKVKTRALVEYKNFKVGVPEIVGAGSTELRP